jgi:hypothetical protein
MHESVTDSHKNSLSGQVVLAPWRPTAMRYAQLLALFVTVAQAALPTIHIVAHSHCDPGWLETYEVIETLVPA